jgi:hypothetical protein
MDDETPAHDVFSSRGLWQRSTFFADPDAYESALFAPLQLDSESVASPRPRRVEHN